MSAYLQQLSKRLGVKLTEDEKDKWFEFEEIMDYLMDLGDPENFEPEKGFEDPDFDPMSASIGFEAGMEAFAEELFERLVEMRIIKESLKDRILH